MKLKDKKKLILGFDVEYCIGSWENFYNQDFEIVTLQDVTFKKEYFEVIISMLDNIDLIKEYDAFIRFEQTKKRLGANISIDVIKTLKTKMRIRKQNILDNLEYNYFSSFLNMERIIPVFSMSPEIETGLIGSFLCDVKLFQWITQKEKEFEATPSPETLPPSVCEAETMPSPETLPQIQKIDWLGTQNELMYLLKLLTENGYLNNDKTKNIEVIKQLFTVKGKNIVASARTLSNKTTDNPTTRKKAKKIENITKEIKTPPLNN